MSYLVLFVTSLVFIALRAFQQLNVQHDRYLWVPPTTLGMALCEVTSIATIVKIGSWHAALPMAVGGVLGCWAAMYAHRRLRNE
jgi:uncharacterized membrane protein YfcA